MQACTWLIYVAAASDSVQVCQHPLFCLASVLEVLGTGDVTKTGYI